MSVVLEHAAKTLTGSGLVTAFLFAGIVFFMAGFLAEKLTRGRIHASAIAIFLGLIAAYIGGGRFFELKTVQVTDGEALAKCIARPCINAEDEGYNCEWSTELTVEQAYEEYVKAWCVLKVIARAFDLGDPDGFVFHMSVGYDLEGIRSPKLDRFIEGLKDASDRPIFTETKNALKEFYPE